MLIGVISDTHGSLQGWKKAVERFRDCEMVFHAGDVLYHGPRNPLPEGYNPKELADALNNFPLPLFIVRGNCDSEVEEVMLDLPILSPYFYASLEGVRVLLLHGTNLKEEELARQGEKYKADVVIFGHIHTPVAKKVGETVLFNPGSPSISFNTEPTLGFLDTEMRKARIITLEKGETFCEINF